MKEIIFFGGFLILILSILLLDLGVFSKKNHTVKFKEALAWTFTWISFALGFYVLLSNYGHYLHDVNTIEELHARIAKFQHPVKLTGVFDLDIMLYNKNLALEFITGYLIEYALSIDNIFIIIIILTSFNVKEKFYKKILFWGVMGAIVMRFLFIFLGAALIARFHWIMYLFGGVLIYTGLKMMFKKESDENMNFSQHPVTKALSKVFNVFPRFVGSSFFLRFKGKLYVTPLFVALMVVEFTDLVFAFDSVPAIFSVTKDPYIVFFSNIFAIMGLRSLFFVLANILHLFHLLKYGLSVLLLFIGTKMLLEDYLHEIGFKTQHSLLIISAILLVSILLSLAFPKKDHKPLQ